VWLLSVVPGITTLTPPPSTPPPPLGRSLENLTAVWLLSVVPGITCAASGGILARSIPVAVGSSSSHGAEDIVLGSYLLW
jgi:hypothetical protein